MKKLLKITAVMMLFMIALGGCGKSAKGPEVKELPAPESDPDNMFGVDKNINMTTIDQWLGRDDVAYRDVRMLFDPASYADIGGDSVLSRTIEGFKIVPYPYIATLQALPVAGAYDGECLYDVVWGPDGKVVSALENYAESYMILEELFPKDKAVFIMCGGGGYAGMMKELLIYLGWDPQKLYNVGGNWSYSGDHSLELVVFSDEYGGDNVYATWRADYAYIDFTKLHREDE